MKTLKDFDHAIAVIRHPLGNRAADTLCDEVAKVLEMFKQSQLDLINELLTMYDSASEHNVDIGRDAIFKLAQRLAGEE